MGKSPLERAHEEIDRLCPRHHGDCCDHREFGCSSCKEAHAALDEAVRDAQHKSYGTGYNDGRKKRAPNAD